MPSINEWFVQAAQQALKGDHYFMCVMTPMCLAQMLDAARKAPWSRGPDEDILIITAPDVVEDILTDRDWVGPQDTKLGLDKEDLQAIGTMQDTCKITDTPDQNGSVGTIAGIRVLTSKYVPQGQTAFVRYPESQPASMSAFSLFNPLDCVCWGQKL